MELHGGDLSVESVVGQGSRFTFPASAHHILSRSCIAGAAIYRRWEGARITPSSWWRTTRRRAELLSLYLEGAGYRVESGLGWRGRLYQGLSDSPCPHHARPAPPKIDGWDLLVRSRAPGRAGCRSSSPSWMSVAKGLPWAP